MKKCCFILLLPLFLFNFSCNNATDSQIAENSLTISVKNTEVYEYKTGISGDEEGTSIVVQAKIFEISEIVRNIETHWETVYKYKPKSGFTGTDYVELELSTGSDGASPPTNVEKIKIKFVVH